MEPTNVIDSSGNLDRVELDGNKLIVEGWSASVGAGRLVAIRVMVYGRRCQVIQSLTGLASPDVNIVWPTKDNSAACRFSFHAIVSPDVPGMSRDLVMVVEPKFEKGVGTPLRQLLAPSLPDPPEHMIKLIGSNFRQGALEFLSYFTEYGGLRRTDNVLDVGCGVGRMTYGLVGYLLPTSRYEGFDIIPDLIHWAQNQITPRFPNFRFYGAPIYNSFYNPSGHLKPDEFIFPYEESTFDFSFLTSVFTHMPGSVIRHYIREIRRVLKPGGRCLITCFLLDGESNSLILAGKSTLHISHQRDDSKIADPENPEYAVGYDEALLTHWLEINGLSVIKTLKGNWCGRPDYVSYQDILIVQG